MIDSPNTFGHGLSCGREHFEQHRAGTVRVRDVAVMERMRPALAGQSDLQMAKPAEPHPLAAANDLDGDVFARRASASDVAVTVAAGLSRIA